MIKSHNNRTIKNIIKVFKNKPPNPCSSSEQTFYCWFGTIKNDKKTSKKVSTDN